MRIHPQTRGVKGKIGKQVKEMGLAAGGVLQFGSAAGHSCSPPIYVDLLQTPCRLSLLQ